MGKGIPRNPRSRKARGQDDELTDAEVKGGAYAMAIFHLHMQVISRSKGRSATAASAFRASARIIDERTGIEHDYTHKGDVVHSEVLLPDGMPDEMRDREVLWNSVELVERRNDAQLARELEAALPLELSRDEQIALARDFVQREFVDRGMAADWALHDPANRATGRRNNPHIHCMLTVRKWDSENGVWAAKYHKEYLCRDTDGREEYLSPADLRSRADEGWAKVYDYRSAGNLTQAEAAERGLGNSDRASKSPLDRTVATTDWNTVDRLVAWREEWARSQNDALERHYEAARTPERERVFVDHRSYADQGRDDLVPTKHMGHKRTAVEEREMRTCEREGREYEPVTVRGRDNAEAREANCISEQLRDLVEQRRALAAELDAAISQTSDLRDAE